MIRVTLRSLFARRRRAALTAVAVLLGVSIISGTFVFTDTINAAFRQLFSATAKGADVIVSSRQDISSAQSAPASMPVSLVSSIRRLAGVASAQGQVSDTATIVDRNGKAIRRTGAPTIALSYLPPPFGGMTFIAGRRPRSSGEVAVDQATADQQGYKLGEIVPIVTGQPVRSFRISGIVRFGSQSTGGIGFAVFDLGTARGLYGKEGRVDRIYVAAARGVAPAAVVREIEPLLTPELVARPAGTQVDTDLERIGNQLNVLTGGLLAFGFIALLVGALVIFNTFSITVAQRLGELALLRALGATRLQVLGSVLLEAAALGAVASAAGIAGGLLAATAIRGLFTALGFGLPATGLVLSLRTVLVALGVGVLVTVAAGLIPALRATRVAPLEALRESSAARLSPLRRRLAIVTAAVLAITGLALVFTSSGTVSARLATSAAGAILLVLAVVMMTPQVIGRLSRIVAWPLERDGRILGRLARENAARNPGRTAVSAASLMIGLALVLFVTVYAAGLRTSTSRIIERAVLGDFTIESQDGTSLIPAAAARAASAAPGLGAVSTLKAATAALGSSTGVTGTGVDPTTIEQVYKFDWLTGSSATVASLSFGDVLVERDAARAAHLNVGDKTTVKTETGLRVPVTVRGIYRDTALLQGFVLPLAQFNGVFHQERLRAVLVRLLPDADRVAAAAALDGALAGFPGVVSRSQQQLRDKISSRVNSILILFYALLAMSVLMSLLGIVNTLSLSIHERTRELGMLRAVGMTARQTRTLIRDEALITAAIGTVIGVCLGLFLAWIVTRALTDEGIVFAIPWLQVVVVGVVGIAAGILASLPPAARAARLNVLAAIARE